MITYFQQLDPVVQLLLVSVLVATAFHNIAWSLGFFSTETDRSPLPSITFKHLAMALLAFLLLQAVILPLILAAVVSFFSAELGFSEILKSPKTNIWMNIVSIFVAAPLLWKFCSYLEPEFCHAIIGTGKPSTRFLSAIRNLLLGASIWFLVFPLAQIVGQLTDYFVTELFSQPEADQEAVKLFKMTFNNPWQYWLTCLGIMTVVPFVEELITRGFLQTWLKQHVGAFWAIILASLVFASLHYSHEQGLRNFELMPALFVLSCYLGYLFERQHSLWAPIGLHATFNVVSMTMITYQTALEG